MSGAQHNETRDVSGAVAQSETMRDVIFNLAPPEPPPAARQFPRTDRRYTNRLAELREVDRVVEDVVRRGRGARYLLIGPEGIGKSALMAEIGARSRADFDESLHLDLAEVRDREGSADYAQALRRLLFALHDRTAEGLTDVARLRRRFQDITGGRSLLLFLDDVADREELALFTPGEGRCLLVAACRPGFVGAALEQRDGAEVIELGALRTHDGLRLLREYSAVDTLMREPDEAGSAEELVALCGGLPLALRVAATHLDRRPELTIGDLVDAVRARVFAEPGTPSAQAVIELGLARLSARETELIARAAEHPGRFFPPELGTALMGPDGPDLIDGLVETGVLRPTGASGYSIAELARQTVRSGPVRDPGRVAADRAAILRFFGVGHRLADLYGNGERFRLADVMEADESTVAPADYPQPFATPAEAGDWQDRHLGHTPGLMRSAVDIGRPAAALLLADHTWPAHYNRRRLAAGTAVYGYAVRLARTLGHQHALARCLTYLARLHLELEDRDRAAELLREADAAADASGEPLNHAVVLEARGLLYGRGASPDRTAAREALAASRAIHRERGRARGDVLQTYQLAEEHRRAGEPDRALEELRDAEARAERRLTELDRADDPRRSEHLVHDWKLIQGRVQLALARVLDAQGRAEEAERRAEAARRVFDDAGQPVREARALRLLAEIAERRGDTEYCRALRIRTQRLFAHYHLDDDAAEVHRRIPPRPASGPTG
ncbi:tetratricopeptide (TPR) repeat protein [Nocardiopsis mwathae]|uniref:Tetratricopeptide (TPR) repeat protein n=1 Tax=Nocardiopsis mwathae TaxID=1472723 RepID=A0A7W9YFL4_9ACTN|nr:NB-ARC domain-containing protein [Nocardiopsis mwathae]MBB6171192.1 tetratricopeptide (TPR) repeat protein [Nocardiopsis mwathae]